MIFEVRQTTRYDYAYPVPFAKHTLRMFPVDRFGQTTLSSDVVITPTPTRQRAMLDFFGNRVLHVDLEHPHGQFLIAVTARIRVDPFVPMLFNEAPHWEQVARSALASTNFGPLSPVHALSPSRLIPLDPEIGAYAAQSFPAGRSVMEGADDLMRRIHRDFRYDPEATEVDTTPLQAFLQRGGVCQDFAHIMISGLRWLGLPAAYVSGYLRTFPAPGQPKLQGADATHAWVMVWCGEQQGWRGLDPTNACATQDNHIIIAIGRDYADVSPVDGMIVASGGQRLKVEVDVWPLGENEPPSHLPLREKVPQRGG